jgi:hypothetical protein
MIRYEHSAAPPRVRRDRDAQGRCARRRRRAGHAVPPATWPPATPVGRWASPSRPRTTALLHQLTEASSDDVYSLIANDRLYVDLRAAALTEAERAHVFSDAMSTRTHTVIVDPVSPPTTDASRGIPLAAASRILRSTGDPARSSAQVATPSAVGGARSETG